MLRPHSQGGELRVILARAGATVSRAVRSHRLAAGPRALQVRDFIKITSTLDDFGVEDLPLDAWIASQTLPRLRAIEGTVRFIDPLRNEVHLQDGRRLGFDKCCICTGAEPIVPVSDAAILGLRDADVSCRGEAWSIQRSRGTTLRDQRTALTLLSP